MKKMKWFVLASAVLFVLPLTVAAREVTPIVSHLWLEKNLTNPKVVIVDIRSEAEYKAGHIPNAVHAPYDRWAITKNELKNEFPEENDLYALIGSSGIKSDSIVVVVGKTDSTTDLVNATRVAKTLIYTGISSVAILSGGQNKWTSDKKPLSTEMTKPKAVPPYKGNLNKDIVATKEYVSSQLGKSIFIDARLPEFFYGISKTGDVGKFGRLPGALPLPSAWIYTDGMYKFKEELEPIAFGTAGKDLSKEIILFCDTGRLSTGWWYVLREVLGYKNVKSYDASLQEWSKDPNAPMVRYSWQ
jgi:thiosulfate/3-mercaptopyruvate sulfurtransferase